MEEKTDNTQDYYPNYIDESESVGKKIMVLIHKNSSYLNQLTSYRFYSLVYNLHKEENVPLEAIGRAARLSRQRIEQIVKEFAKKRFGEDE